MSDSQFYLPNFLFTIFRGSLDIDPKFIKNAFSAGQTQDNITFIQNIVPDKNRQLQNVQIGGEYFKNLGVHSSLVQNVSNIAHFRVAKTSWDKQDPYYGYTYDETDLKNYSINADGKLEVEINQYHTYKDSETGQFSKEHNCPFESLSFSAPEMHIRLDSLPFLKSLKLSSRKAPSSDLYRWINPHHLYLHLAHLPSLKLLDLSEFTKFDNNWQIKDVPFDCKLRLNPKLTFNCRMTNPMHNSYLKGQFGWHDHFQEKDELDYTINLSDFCVGVDPNKVYEISYGEFLKNLSIHQNNLMQNFFNSEVAYEKLQLNKNQKIKESLLSTSKINKK